GPRRRSHNGHGLYVPLPAAPFYRFPAHVPIFISSSSTSIISRISGPDIGDRASLRLATASPDASFGSEEFSQSSDTLRWPPGASTAPRDSHRYPSRTSMSLHLCIPETFLLDDGWPD